MNEKIIQKLDAEYECFVNDMLRTSKENLFAKSEEITVKKSIQNVLRDLVANDQRFEEKAFADKILYTNNVMEMCYRFASDYKNLSTEDACKKALFSL